MTTSTRRIAYLGPIGTFTEQALLGHGDLAACDLIPLPKFFDADSLRSIRAKHADVKFLGSYPANGVGSTAVRREATAAWAEADAWMDGLREQITD